MWFCPRFLQMHLCPEHDLNLYLKSHGSAESLLFEQLVFPSRSLLLSHFQNLVVFIKRLLVGATLLLEAVFPYKK